MSNNLNEVLKALGEAMKKPIPEALMKSWSQSGSPTSGITAYDLEAPAKQLVPVLTPLRNIIPRVGGGVGTAVNWRAVTAINTGLMEIGVSEGNRSGIIAHTTKDYTAAYKGIGLEDYVTYEADYAAQSFDDVKALAVNGLLNSLMIGEEVIILGGDNSLALGTTPTPTLVASTTGGTLASATYSVICVALTHSGVYSGSVVNGIRASVTRNNADGTTDVYGGGSARKSTNATVAVTGPTGSLTASVTPVNGAIGYAWFWATAGAEVLGAITTINSVLITANATGTQTAASLPAADNSQNNLVFDGLLTQCFTPSLNAYFAAQPTGTAGTGTPLTADTEGGIVEFDAALKAFWDNYRLSPTAIYVSSQEMLNIHKKILTGGTNTATRLVFSADQGAVLGGMMVRSYLNKFSMNGAVEIPIKLHPNMPPGTVLFFSKTLPYPLSNVPNTVQIRTRSEYYQIEWPLRARRYEYGVYADEVLQNYAPFAFGATTNIGNG